MVRKSSPNTLPMNEEAARALAAMTAENVEATLEAKPHGRGELLLRYCGPLARRRKLFVRFGERREGREWVAPRDLEMSSANGEATVVISLGEGAPVEGACFAFYSPKSGAAEPVWDNAGRPFGYYLFDAQTGLVVAR